MPVKLWSIPACLHPAPPQRECQLLDVRAWNSKVRCVVTCAGETREATARITAFSEGDRDSGRAGVRGEGWRKRVVGNCFRGCLWALSLLL